MIAESIIAAASDMGPMRVPVVVRLQGTNSEEGLKLVRPPSSIAIFRVLLDMLTALQLEKANLGLHVVADFGEAAKTAMELAKV